MDKHIFNAKIFFIYLFRLNFLLTFHLVIPMPDIQIESEWTNKKTNKSTKISIGNSFPLWLLHWVTSYGERERKKKLFYLKVSTNTTTKHIHFDLFPQQTMNALVKVHFCVNTRTSTRNIKTEKRNHEYLSGKFEWKPLSLFFFSTFSSFHYMYAYTFTVNGLCFDGFFFSFHFTLVW